MGSLSLVPASDWQKNIDDWKRWYLKWLAKWPYRRIDSFGEYQLCRENNLRMAGYLGLSPINASATAWPSAIRVVTAHGTEMREPKIELNIYIQGSCVNSMYTESQTRALCFRSNYHMFQNCQKKGIVCVIDPKAPENAGANIHKAK